MKFLKLLLIFMYLATSAGVSSADNRAYTHLRAMSSRHTESAMTESMEWDPGMNADRTQLTIDYCRYFICEQYIY